MDLFGDQATTSDALLFDSDRRLIVEIISRELADRSITDEVNFFKNKYSDFYLMSFFFLQTTTAYLSLLALILRNRSIIAESCTRIAELQTSFRAHLYAENCLKENRLIIDEILRKHCWLSTNDMPFYL
jgi:hypothetical protein